jgi:hypothetical protein
MGCAAMSLASNVASTKRRNDRPTASCGKKVRQCGQLASEAMRIQLYISHSLPCGDGWQEAPGVSGKNLDGPDHAAGSSVLDPDLGHRSPEDPVSDIRRQIVGAANLLTLIRSQTQALWSARHQYGVQGSQTSRRP